MVYLPHIVYKVAYLEPQVRTDFSIESIQTDEQTTQCVSVSFCLFFGNETLKIYVK